MGNKEFEKQQECLISRCSNDASLNNTDGWFIFTNGSKVSCHTLFFPQTQQGLVECYFFSVDGRASK